MPEPIRKRAVHHELGENRGINITALIDVVFQLLIFFMLASSLVKPNQIELDLPTSSSGVKAQENQVLSVRYRLQDGAAVIMLNDAVFNSLEALRTAMTDQRPGEGQPLPRVDLLIEQSVPYQDVVNLMDAVREAGFGKFSLLTMAPGPPGPAANATDATEAPDAAAAAVQPPHGQRSS